MVQHSSDGPVFEAKTPLRRGLVTATFAVSIALAMLTVVVFWAHVTNIDLMTPTISPNRRVLDLDAGAPVEPVESVHAGQLALAGPAPKLVYNVTPDGHCAVPASSPSREVMAYLPAGDAAARASLARNCGTIGTVFAETWRLEDWQGAVTLTADADMPAPVKQVLPVLTLGPWLDPSLAEAQLSDPAFLSGLAFRLELISERAGSGLCLDLSTQPNLSGATAEAAVLALAGSGPRCLIGPAEASFWEAPQLVETVDIAVMLGFRAPDGPAQPPAPAAWFAKAVERATTLIPADKLVLALGTRGFSWQSGARGLREVGYTDAMAAAADEAAQVRFVPWANAARTRFVMPTKGLTETWLPDAASLYNQLNGLASGVQVAIWPLGAEDPSIWPLLNGAQPRQESLEAPIRMDQAVRITGDGPVVVAAAAPVAGQRVVVIDEVTDQVIAADYATVPVPAALERGGNAADGDLSLSFSSLPPAELWPTLASILAEAELEATFLLESRDLLADREVVRRVVEAGHVVGLRQPERSATPPQLQRIVDNFRQALMLERTGFGSRVVEVGKVGDWSTLAATAGPLLAAGYLPLVPVDDARYQVLDQIGTELVPTPLPGAAAQSFPDSRIAIAASPAEWEAVLHDLPLILQELARQGYRFRPLTVAAGLESVAAMPALPQPAAQFAVSAVFAVLAFGIGELNIIFFCFLMYSAARSSIYLVLALARRPKRDFHPNWSPPVSVLIPAYNEAKVIEKCIRSILEAPYPNLQVVVVDDGSTDDTSEVVRVAFGDDSRVKLLRQPNRGKWAAANRGLEAIETPFFLIADADSIFTPHTIGWLVQQFRDESVGAVAGLVEVGNRGSFLGSCQALEYIVSQSVMRRAQEVFDGILVVPGAVGAWRTRAVREAGLFSGDTVTEDADLTVAVHRAGYRVAFQEQARSVTEAPTSVRDFMRQRLRWTFGMLQTSWKHRGAIAEGQTVGYISIIDAIWFGVVSSVFAPLVDFLMLLLVVQGIWAMTTGGAAVLASLPVSLFVAYFALTLLDVANTLAAFRFENRFDWKLLTLVPVLRFGYRQLLYISTIRAIVQALIGTAAGWNKLERSGATLSLWSPVKMPFPMKTAKRDMTPAE